MSYRMSLSALVVLNGGCPIDRWVFGGDAARIVIGEVPDAFELALNFAGVSELADALNTTLAEMAATPGVEPEDDPDDPEEAEPLAAHADINGHAPGSQP